MNIKTKIASIAGGAPCLSRAPQHSDEGFYAPSEESRRRGGHTVISGMRGIPEHPVSSDGSRAMRESIIKLQARPIFGLLYSVSCDAFGEIYPLYVGRNIVGNVPEADIYLAEQTISESHAVILIRNIREEGGAMTTTSVVDNESQFGTSVNGERIGYDIVYLRSGDRLCFGNSYEFIFIPIDAENMGLFLREDFMPVKRVVYNPYTPVLHVNESSFEDDGIVYPNVVGAEDEATFYGRSKKKEEDHSSNKTVRYVAGKTQLDQKPPAPGPLYSTDA